MGGSGDDILSGNGGFDVLYSGSDLDRDIFYLNNLYTGSDYALIVDFDKPDPGEFSYDRIVIRGEVSDYTLSYSNFGVGTASLDTEIRLDGNLIAVVQDVQIDASSLENVSILL